MKRIRLVVGLLLLLLPSSATAQSAAPTPEIMLLRDIYKEVVEINTTDSAGDTTVAARAMAARLKAGGFTDAEMEIVVPPGAPKKGNLVARLRGTGAKKPLLLIAHLDVVEARREEWERDPFKLVEEDGYFYARGSSDDKAMVAIFVANMIRYKKEGYVPDRDLILALTADEELGSTSPWNGASWLLKNRRALIDADLAINEGGGGEMTRDGRPVVLRLQAAEKVSVSFRLETKNPGGHSSLPRKDNAIYQLAEGLVRFSHHEFPVKLNEITRGYFERSAQFYPANTADDMRAVARSGGPDLAAAARLSAASPFANSVLRTTCVATRLDGGHAGNALPQTARATVNCRVLPGEPIDEVREEIVKAVGDAGITVTRTSEPEQSPASPLRPDVVQAVEASAAALWPGVPVVPSMSTGATDSRFLRNAGISAYGVSGIFLGPDDARAHGLNERMPVKSLYGGYEFLYRLVKTLGGGR
ncbi:MAG TPA: M20/M25/M40 family metallo-hydrolase [Candidatus Bathyarchaeia archaeon]|nr:M20/M25/M40 family metallo-hydrolase [Candidatus Bathyarchaeia archaeon]